jgi:hypothetical protein
MKKIVIEVLESAICGDERKGCRSNQQQAADRLAPKEFA